MALVLPDRVQQTGKANTTVSFTLVSTISGFQSFASVGDGNSTYYAATDTANNWEVGVGTYTASGTLLTRSVILSSSNSGSAVTFVGTVTVFVTYPGSVFFNPAVPSAIGTTTPAAGTFTTLIGGGGSTNYQQVSGAATGKGVVQSVLGADANIAQVFQSKGAGAIDLAAGSSGVNISNGGSVTSITRVAAGFSYSSVPSIVISPPTTAGGVQATAVIGSMGNTGSTVVSGGTGYAIGNTLTVVGGTSTGPAATLIVTGVSSGVITSATPLNSGQYTALPTNPVTVTGGNGSGATFNLDYGIGSIPSFTITNAGSGYVEQPTVTFSGGGGSGAAAYATVGAGAIIRSLGTTGGVASIDFYTPASASNGVPALRIRDVTSDSYLMIQGGGSYTNLVAQGNSGASIGIFSNGGGNLSLGTRGTSQATQLRIADTASAVNYVQVTGAATGAGSGPIFSAQGADANINISFQSKGSGYLNLLGNQANYFQFYGGNATQAPVIYTWGSDANIDLGLTPKGTGVLKFGSLTTTADAPITGYITIKDSGGTVRKLAVIA